TAVDDAYGYQRSYEPGEPYAHLTGYFSASLSAMTGLEQGSNRVLNGTADSLIVQRIQNLITGRQPQGGSIELTIDPGARPAAWDALGYQQGAVVALDATTGAIRAMVSKPSYDPNALAAHSGEEAQTAYDSLQDDEDHPLTTRAISERYAPGSV